MSGPIVRKYGFPNFDKIFGSREVPHGAPQQETDSKPEPPAESAPKDDGSPPGADATPGQKASEDSAQL